MAELRKSLRNSLNKESMQKMMIHEIQCEGYQEGWVDGWRDALQIGAKSFQESTKDRKNTRHLRPDSELEVDPQWLSWLLKFREQDTNVHSPNSTADLAQSENHCPISESKEQKTEKLCSTTENIDS
mmetsp:Transcript_7378/g.13318  ORF Transcript_7378/g.13318 Transcript_7378/m.13318 type:complete len:127 (-) Transcript_7378:1815-2195(-)